MATQTFVFVLGGPGSGKGTLCQKLKEGYPDWEHISVGELLRKEVATESEKGQQWAQLMNKGQMVPTDDVLDLLEVTTKGSSVLKFFLDGFPRAPDQVKAFQNRMGKPTSAIIVNVPEDVLKQRLLERGAASGRQDDNEETIEERLTLYSQNVLPCVESLQEICKVQPTDGNRTVAEVFEDVKVMINEIEEAPTKIESEDAPLDPSKEESSNQDAPALPPENSKEHDPTDTTHPESSTAPAEEPLASTGSEAENRAVEDAASCEQTAQASGDAPADVNKESTDNSSSTPQKASPASITESPVNAGNEPLENSEEPKEMAAPTEGLPTEGSPETTEGTVDNSLKTPVTEGQSEIHENALNDSPLDANDLPEESMGEKLDDGAEHSTADLTPENLLVGEMDNLSEPVVESPEEAPAETVQETETETKTAPIEEFPEPVTDGNLNQGKIESKCAEAPIQKPVDTPETVPDQSGNVTPSGTEEQTTQSIGEVCTDDQPRNSGTESSNTENSTNQPTYVESLEDSAEAATKKSNSSGAVHDAPVEAVSQSPSADDIETPVEKKETQAFVDLEERPATLIPEEQSEILQDTPPTAEDISAFEEDAEAKSKEEAVLKIQAAERDRQARKAQKALVEQEKAAKVIQSACRDYVARKETKMRNEAMEQEKAKAVEAEVEPEVESEPKVEAEPKAEAEAEEEEKAAPVNEETNELNKPSEDNLEPEPTGQVAGRVPVREYMDSTVVPILREGLKSLNRKRPADPLQYLADFLLDRKKTCE